MFVEMNEEEKKAHQKQKTNGIILSVLILFVLFFLPPILFGSLTNGIGSSIEKQVISDSIRQYNIAVRTGNYMDAYVQAGIITAAYLQTENEAKYVEWKAIQKRLGRTLGIPF